MKKEKAECNWCYDLKYFTGEPDQPDIPCGKCMRGKVPSSTDLRKTIFIKDFSRQEQKGMRNIPSQDLREAS